ncbi:MAG: hypothetical protein ACSLFP_07990 [Acidimicrobiales bacterium]
MASTGCGDDDAPAAATTTTAEAASTTTEADEPTLVDEPVAGFEERDATFANLTYTVVGARVSNQDLRSYAEGTEPEATDARHLILDVEVANPTGRQIGSDADAIALEVDDETAGVADDFLTDATGFIPANESIDGFLAFEIDDDAPAAEAVVVFGVAPDRPVRLPLTGEVPEPEFPIELTVSGTAEGPGPTSGGTIRFELLGATLFDDLPHGDTTSPTGERADEGEVFLQLHLRATKVDGRGNELLRDDAFRLLVDGVPRGPFDEAVAPEGSTSTPTAEPGVAVDAWVLFAVDAGAATYVLEVGDLEDAPGSISLEVPAT